MEHRSMIDLYTKVRRSDGARVHKYRQRTTNERKRGFKYISAINMLNTYVYAHKTDVSHTHIHIHTTSTQ